MRPQRCPQPPDHCLPLHVGNQGGGMLGGGVTIISLQKADSAGRICRLTCRFLRKHMFCLQTDCSMSSHKSKKGKFEVPFGVSALAFITTGKGNASHSQPLSRKGWEVTFIGMLRMKTDIQMVGSCSLSRSTQQHSLEVDKVRCTLDVTRQSNSTPWKHPGLSRVVEASPSESEVSFQDLTFVPMIDESVLLSNINKS
jgi:hypothetical protein